MHLTKRTKQKPRWSAYALSLVFALGAVFASPSAQAQTFTSLYSFQGPPDGISPDSPLLELNGNLYGTTSSGGKYLDWQYGTLFELSSTGQESVLYDFIGEVWGAVPYGGLTDVGGGLYGTTLEGGDLSSCFAIGCGTVFSNGQVVYTFAKPADGAFPQGGLVLDAEGNFYGTTSGGGDLNCKAGNGFGCGVVFKLGTNGKETVLHTFHAGADGAVPAGSLIRDNKGRLYGATSQGGEGGNLNCDAPPWYGCGVVFKVDRAGKETLLHRFTGGATHGAYPNPGSLVMDARFNLYGATYGGGTFNLGTVFKIDKTGKETVLHSFGGGVDGVAPYAGLVRDAAGNLYGVTWSGGTSNLGTVFKMTKSGKETVLHSFAGVDGKYPGAGLLMDTAGNLYGTTTAGGTSYYGYGTVFKITP